MSPALPPCLRLGPGSSVELDCHLVPRASQDKIGAIHGDRLKVHIKAPPVDGKANAALLKFLAKNLGVPPSSLSLVRGATSKRKTIRIEGAPVENVRSRLGIDEV